MLNFEEYFQREFGEIEIHHALFLEELKELSLYIRVEKLGNIEKAQLDLSEKLGIQVRVIAMEDTSLSGLFLYLEEELAEKGDAFPEDFCFRLEAEELFLSCQDSQWLEEHLEHFIHFFSLWKKELTLLIEPLENSKENQFRTNFEEDDFEEDDCFHDSIDEELRLLVKQSAQIKNTKRVKRPHKYLQEVKGPFVKISHILEEEQGQRVAIEGELLFFEKRELKSGKKLVDLTIYDGSASLGCKLFCSDKDEEILEDLLQKGEYYRLQGNLNFDQFSREMILYPNRINPGDKPAPKMDRAPKKRVELHLHSSMSEIDGVAEIEEYMKRAHLWGHKALAITDLSTAHAFPKAFECSKKYDLKLLYGMEILFYDDEKKVVDVSDDLSFHGTFIALDLETTGLRSDRDEIIEIGAVRIQNYHVVDSFHCLIKPHQEIPPFITELTGITNEMVSSAPRLEEVFEDFLSFIGEDAIVGHNLDFDRGFIQKASDSLGYSFSAQGIDTLALSRLVLRDIKRHRLNQVAKRLKIGQEEHHRALDDALVCGKIFVSLLRLLENDGVESFTQINTLADKQYYISSSRKYAMSLLCKNTESLKKLYEMASISNLNYLEYNKPLVPASLLKKFREYFYIGSSGSDGWLVDNLIMCKPEKEVLEFLTIYDYLEIQPLGQYERYLNRHILKGTQDVKEIHNKILKLGDRASLSVVATGDVRYLDKDDFLYRNIVRAGQNKNLSLEKEGNHYFRTTAEMLDEFSHLGDRAEEVVIDNSLKIMNSIEEIQPMPKGTFPPFIEGSEEELRKKCYERAQNRYGKPLPEMIKNRLEYELGAIINNGFAVLYIIAEKLVNKSKEAGYLVGSRGSVGSSFAATMAGITEVNPLPPHYYCSECQYSEFIDEALYDNGFDMLDKDCPRCGGALNKDGFNIPFESFMGFEGNKEPDIDLNFAPNIQGMIHKYTEELFGKGHVFKAGTVSKVAERTAFGYIMKYYEEREEKISSREVERIISRITGIRRSSGQHPGGIIVIPQDQSIYNFTPIQYPANDPNSDVITTHFDYDALQGKLLKLDILGHDVPSIIHDLEEMTGVNSSTVRFDDKQILGIFNSTKNLNLQNNDYDLKKGTLGIPEFGTNFVRSMLEDTKPQNLADLIRISGLSHGTNVWINNAQNLVRSGTITIKDVIATREQIMVYGIQMGIPRDQAFNIMERVRKGKGLSEEDLAIMQKAKVPLWYLNSCNRISYMFPKAHAVAYVLMSFRIAYYKVYHPLAFYASNFSTKVEDFDAENMTKGIERVLFFLNTEKDRNDMTKKEQDYFALMEVVYEMYARGLEFEAVDLYRSHAWKFLISKGKILPPLRAISGVGLTAAEGIVRERNEPFISIEDLQIRAKLNRTAVEALRNHGCLEDLTESNQISLFEFL